MALTGEITGSLLASMNASGGVNGEIAFDGSGTDNYNELDNKPSINGVTLEGNKTSADLHISSKGTDNYNDLLNKPKINGTTLTGDVSDTQLLIDYNHLINKPVIPDISEIETRLDTAETDIDNLQSDIVTAENDIDNINDEIATIKATDLTQNADINSLKNRVTSAETNISNLSTRVSSAETSISNHTTEISSIEDDVTGLDTRVGTAEGDIDTLLGDMTQAQSDISELNSSLIGGKYGYMNWNDISVNSGSWATNTGNVGTGMRPSKDAIQNAYNYYLDIPGTYLVIYKATFNDSNNKTGLRGLRSYINETNSGEEFTAPAGNTTTITVCRMVESDGTATTRMGLFQSSGGAITATKIQIIALYMGR